MSFLDDELMKEKVSKKKEFDLTVFLFKIFGNYSFIPVLIVIWGVALIIAVLACVTGTCSDTPDETETHACNERIIQTFKNGGTE